MLPLASIHPSPLNPQAGLPVCGILWYDKARMVTDNVCPGDWNHRGHRRHPRFHNNRLCLCGQGPSDLEDTFALQQRLPDTLLMGVDVDRVDFAMRVTRQDGLLVMEPARLT